MAIFKPESNGSFTDFTGICAFGIVDFKDKSENFDWADIFLEATVKQKGSDYDRVLQIKGQLDKENGKITGGSVLKKMYHFFEQIGCDAGITVDGKWEDSQGNAIEDIAKYLSDNHLSSVIPGTDPKYDFIGYFYKEIPKTPGGKSYTRIYSKVYKNSEDNKVKLDNDIKWIKSKGYLKELTDEPVKQAEMSESGLANL
tara:strand:+ start:225 stop:821 length:597 start_codon:yes stop_codon:yes gene_type:complete